MSGDTIRFWHRGQIVEIDGVPATTTVLDWLRRDALSTGTKEGCNEGDCGACTVVVGDVLDAHDERTLRLRTINSCLTFLPMLHGRALITIEDLVDLHGGTLHPAQRAMIDSHGSQCGFCTPGVVMSLWTMLEQGRADGVALSRQGLADGLAGNLCRCTGYQSILDAGELMLELGGPALDVEPILVALVGLGAAGLDYRSEGTVFRAPTDLDELAGLIESNPGARIISGATDAGLAVTQGLAEIPEIIWTGRVSSLRDIADVEDDLRIGAGAALDDAWAALVERVPALEEQRLRFASPSIRHAGTMGGNIVNGSPIGDSAPVLLVLEAALELRRGSGNRSVALRDFFTGYQTNCLQPGEFLTAILIPTTALRRDIRAYKVSRRFDSDISAVCGAFAIDMADELIRDVRVAFGGLAPTVRRALATEQAMIGRPWDGSTLHAAQQALAADFTAISDHRASAEYRMQVAGALLERLWLQTGPSQSEHPEASDVWTRR